MRYRVAATITVVDTITSMTSGIIIFGILGNLAHEVGTTDIATVVKGGTGLAFVSYPDAIAKFDWMPQVFSAVFFVMLFVIGIGCVAGLQICLMTAIQDQIGQQGKLRLILVLAGTEFLIGLMYLTPGGQYLVNLVDFFCVSFLIYVMAIAQLVAFCWVYSIRRLSRDVAFMMNSRVIMYWRISWGIVAPILMMFIFVYALITFEPLSYNNQTYPVGIYGNCDLFSSRTADNINRVFFFSAVGWCMSALGILQIPGWMVFEIYRQKGDTLWTVRLR